MNSTRQKLLYTLLCLSGVLRALSDDGQDMRLFTNLSSGTLSLITARTDTLAIYRPKSGLATGYALHSWNGNRECRANGFGIVMLGKDAPEICSCFSDKIAGEFDQITDSANDVEKVFNKVVADANALINESAKREEFKPLVSIVAILIQDDTLYATSYHGTSEEEPEIIPQLKLNLLGAADSRSMRWSSGLYGTPALSWEPKTSAVVRRT